MWSRRLHRWGTVVVLLPFGVMLVTGILLQWKKNADWIQPPAQTSARPGEAPAVSFGAILEALRTAEAAGIREWADVDRLDVRPDRGIVKALAREGGWEVQVDLATGDVLSVAQRRSDLLEALHDGSWFHDAAKLGVFFPVSLVLLVLYGTGVYLWLLPHLARRRRSDAAAPTASAEAPRPAVKPARLPDGYERRATPTRRRA